MLEVRVSTMDGRAYYTIASRLRKAGLKFSSAVPYRAGGEDALVVTTKKEASLFSGPVVTIEDLDEDPLVMKGQIVAKLFNKEEQELLVGIDPGSRIGLAVFYGGTELVSQTFNSKAKLCEVVFEMVRRVPNSRSVVRIGNGERALAGWLSSRIARGAPTAVVEVVDEAGTSVRNPRRKGLPKDQDAAARIAFRKGRPHHVVS